METLLRYIQQILSRRSAIDCAVRRSVSIGVRHARRCSQQRGDRVDGLDGLMAFFPALMQPTMQEITGDDSLALGHFLDPSIDNVFGRHLHRARRRAFAHRRDCSCVQGNFRKIPIDQNLNMSNSNNHHKIF